MTVATNELSRLRSRLTYWRWAAYSLVSALLLIAAGCSDSRRGSVSGTVTLDGNPVEHGIITFLPMEGNSGPSSGGDIVDGKYTISQKRGPSVGSNRVMFTGTHKSGRQVMLRGKVVDEWVDSFPPKYEGKTPEVCTIQPGANKLDFALQSN
jgi:hypothetical protein